ncbi:MAG: nitrile hydratase subunit beta [Rhizobiaceae bacterium]|nr:nitrile hydratase subunit beta [Rhizobiaceae bacterium]
MPRNYHDYGGEPAGPIEVHPHELTFWERRVDAMQQLLSDPRRRFFRSDEFRLMRETMGEAEYERMSYYERWVPAMARLLAEKGIITHAELSKRMAEIAERGGERA